MSEFGLTELRANVNRILQQAWCAENLNYEKRMACSKGCGNCRLAALAVEGVRLTDPIIGIYPTIGSIVGYDVYSLTDSPVEVNYPAPRPQGVKERKWKG